MACSSSLGVGTFFGLAMSLPPSALGSVIAGRLEHRAGPGLDPVEVVGEGPLLVLQPPSLDPRTLGVPLPLDAIGLGQHRQALGELPAAGILRDDAVAPSY